MSILGDIGGGLVRGVKWVGGKIAGLGDRPGEEEQRQGLTDQSNLASGFAGQGEAGFRRMQGNLDRDSDYLRRIADGTESVSKLQLADAADRNVAQQQSMAASASPRDAAMAAFGASRAAADINTGLVGQQATAGLQERQNAQRALADLELGRSGQYMQGALGSRQNAIAGLGNITPGQSDLEKWGGAVQGGLNIFGIGGGGKK